MEICIYWNNWAKNEFAAKEKLVTAVGGIPPSKNLKYVAGKSSFPLRFKPRRIGGGQ